MTTRRRLMAAGVLLALVTGACGGGDDDGSAEAAGLTGTVADHGTAPVSGGDVTIRAADVFFEPTCATKVPRGTVTVKVRNTGAILHNISIARQGIDKDVGRGETVEIKVTVNGTVPFTCKYHSAAGMVGALLPG